MDVSTSRHASIPEHGALLTDFYQLTMLQAYFDRQMGSEAVFEFFVRRLPESRNFLVAAGLEQAVAYLETLRFEEDEITALSDTGLFGAAFLDHLRELRFTGDVDAMPEGTVFFPNEPMLRVVASLPEAQLVESRLINLLHYQTLVASKAARCVLAAPSRMLVDFGMRRAHGSEAATYAARASYLAGFSGTATTIAKPLFDIPIFGTMAHSFIQAHDSESEAFAHFVESHKGAIVLLIDTFDTIAGAQRVVDLAGRLPRGTIHSVRLDSGDLGELSRAVRAILDAAGFEDIQIFASGGLEERAVEALVRGGAPIDGFGIGTGLTVSEDCPALDCVYKLQEYAGILRRKRSTGKATWPGRKQVFRAYDDRDKIREDTLTLVDDPHTGVALLQPIMRSGKLLSPLPSLRASREHAKSELERLPDPLRTVSRHVRFEPTIAPALERAAQRVDARFG